jgi:hypothetical protein
MYRLNITDLKSTLILGAVLLLFSFAVSSAPLTTGESVPDLSLPDQHGYSHTLSSPNTVLFAPDKAAGELAHEVLNHTDKEGMAAKGMVFISDISGMPALVRRMFALPAMREYPYLVLLGYEEEDCAMFPRQEGKVTLLHIKAGKVSGIRYTGSPQELAGIIGIKIREGSESSREGSWE